MNHAINRSEDDHFHDECGVFGLFNCPEAAKQTYLGLYAQQHRGQESAGIVSTDGHTFNSHRGMGLVADVFQNSDMQKLNGHAAIGHVRYSTSGESGLRNCQPFSFEYVYGGIAMCHNGNIVNAPALRKELEKGGSVFQSTSDTEVLMHLVARSKGERMRDRVAEAVVRLQGGFSLLVLVEDRLVGVRDRNGLRPLVLGKLNNAWVLASETCAFDLVGAEYVRDVKAGEMVIIEGGTLETMMPFESTEPKFCVFEYVYFARPDSTLEGVNVYNARYQIGVELGKESPVDADLVIPVPDSGVPPAMGYAESTGIQFQLGLIRNHYIGRTFIEPKQSIRNFGVRLKLNPNRDMIRGKRVVLVDDSIVRGTTSRKIVEMVRAAGAKEVHMRISSPPTKHSCYYGVDTPNEEELMANQMDLDEMCRTIKADSLAFVSFDGMYRAVGKPQSQHCDACFSGHYPVDIDKTHSPQLSLLRFFSRRP